MKYFKLSGWLLFVFFSFDGSAEPLAQQEAQINYQIILKRPAGQPVTQDFLDNISQELQLPVGLQLIRPMAGNAYLVKMKPSQLSQAMRRTKLIKFQLFTEVVTELNSSAAKNSILYASEDFVYPLDPIEKVFLPREVTYPMNYHALQWDEFLAPAGVELESAPGLNDLAWQLTKGAPSVVIAVIDSGVDANIDLNANVLPGWNFPGDNDDVSDETDECLNNGICHGTHVAGTIAALGLTDGNNTLPIGMGPQLKILPEKVFSSTTASDSDIINAMYWAVGDAVTGVPNNTNPAQVLNLSLGTQVPVVCSQAFQDAINAVNTKALIIFAAGNSNGEAGDYSPGNCADIISSGVMTIAATDIQGLRASYSNYGSTVTLAAPGGENNYSPDGMLSTTSLDRFIYIAGTSMAAPHVAGVAGLIYSYAGSLNISLTPQQVQNLLLNNVSNFGESSNPDFNCDPTGVKSCGVGIVNAFAALKAVNTLDKAVFLPPPSTALNLQNHSGVVICKPGLVIPAFSVGARIAVQDNNYTAYWQVIKTGCAVSSTFQSPVINNNILQYGTNTQFAFIGPAGLSCQTINGTSVGCQ